LSNGPRRFRPQQQPLTERTNQAHTKPQLTQRRCRFKLHNDAIILTTSHGDENFEKTPARSRTGGHTVAEAPNRLKQTVVVASNSLVANNVESPSAVEPAEPARYH
jgi:hypothetical protein